MLIHIKNAKGGKERYAIYSTMAQFIPMTFATNEFIRRFLLQVVPQGFMRIRHCGFMSCRARPVEPFQWYRNQKFSLSSTHLSTSSMHHSSLTPFIFTIVFFPSFKTFLSSLISRRDIFFTSSDGGSAYGRTPRSPSIFRTARLLSTCSREIDSSPFKSFSTTL